MAAINCDIEWLRQRMTATPNAPQAKSKPITALGKWSGISRNCRDQQRLKSERTEEKSKQRITEEVKAQANGRMIWMHQKLVRAVTVGIAVAVTANTVISYSCIVSIQNQWQCMEWSGKQYCFAMWNSWICSKMSIKMLTTHTNNRENAHWLCASCNHASCIFVLCMASLSDIYQSTTGWLLCSLFFWRHTTRV